MSQAPLDSGPGVTCQGLFSRDLGSNDFLYENLPDDAEQAFLLLEEAFNEDCKAKLLASRRENENVTIFYVQYISKVLGAIQELGLESKFASQGVPDISDVDYSTYLNFSKDVEHYKTMLKIRSARRQKQYSVAFNETTKAKLRHLLLQMKTTVGKLEVSEEKKEALLTRISAVESEMDRNRTRLEVVGALWVETCTKSEKASRNLSRLDNGWTESAP